MGTNRPDPHRDRTLYERCILGGDTPTEVAREHGWSPRTCMHILQRIRRDGVPDSQDQIRRKGDTRLAEESAKRLAAEKESADLRKRIELMEEQLAQARAPKVPIPVTKAQRQKTKIRLIFPDVHGNHMDRAAVAAMLADVELVKPHEAIGLGDLVECGGWLAAHHSLGFVAEVDQMCYEDDIAASNDLLDRLQAHIPRLELMEGNHEARVEKWCVTSCMRHGGDAEWLRRQIGPEFCLHLEDRGIPYHKYHLQHDGLDVPGVIKRGNLHITHGFSTSKHAAHAHVLQAGGCIAYGHTHRADYAVNRNIAHGMAAAWCPGTLSQMQPLWRHNSPTTWTHGYLLQIIAEDETFQMLQVPIQGGKSFLANVIDVLNT